VARSSRSRQSPTSEAPLVRTASPADAGAIARVRATTWQHAYAHIFTPEQLASISVEESAARLRRQLETAAAPFQTLVAILDEAIVGFAAMGPRDFSADECDVGELYAIYVLPDIQGRGVGRALMTETVERLRSDGFADAVLWVFEDHPRTRRFYEEAGWSVDGGTKDETWLGTTAPTVRYRIALERPST
jgi:GNAT superfamily N-acetyltransferase